MSRPFVVLVFCTFVSRARAGDAVYEGETVAQWVERLSQGDLAARRKAAYALWHLAAPASAEALAEAIGSDDAYVRTTVAKALVKLGAEARAGLAKVAALLCDDRDAVRQEAATTCFRLGPHVGPIVGALTEALASKDPVVRANAAAALGYSGQAAAALPKLEALVADENKDVREWAAFAVARVDPVRALRGGSAAVRIAALRILGDSPAVSPECVAVLLDLVRDKEEEVRVGAANVLGSALLWRDKSFPGGTKAIEEVLLGAYAQEKSSNVRTWIAYAFGRLPAISATTVPWLIECLDASDALLRTHALNALRELGPKAAIAVPAIVKDLGHPDRDTRSGAAFTLGYLAGGVPEAVAALVKSLEDDEPYVVRQAAQALGMLGDASAVPALIRLLEEGPEESRSTAIVALGAIGPGAREAAPLLQKRLSEGPLGREAAFALVAIEAEPPAAAREMLLAALLGDDEQARNGTARLVPWLKARADVLVPPRVAVLEGPAPRRRERAARALAAAGPHAAHALPSLRKAVEDPDPEARKAVEFAIQRIEAK
ncbi:MAG: HEAT repeat domain-containing protein [Planctomycetota bacterium]